MAFPVGLGWLSTGNHVGRMQKPVSFAVEDETANLFGVGPGQLSGSRLAARPVTDGNNLASQRLVVKENLCTQRLIVGGGVKLPTGDYYRKNATTSSRYPMLLQPGTGSTNGFVYANYIASYRNGGISVNASYKLNSENYYQEGIANSAASFVNVFYRIKAGADWLLIPSLQGFYEFTKGETYQNELTGEHRMDNALLGPGLDVFYKNVSVNLAFQLPVYQARTDHPVSAGRTVVSLSYAIKEKKYLLKGKRSRSRLATICLLATNTSH